ncbi:MULTISPECIES: sensor domain-containing diguanylate cyclase [Clostridium]|uniref:Sensor domain-containing diguanylate cyclase n=1 Tax=Clostridium cibarium TaxID=2762247 RepID=A0ABR8PPY9_9CLOT|nr:MULTISPECIES: sensor domain-containing diguanylate cyclase [Clostridium]MBD7910234.1 sensor domain-containing diguanylate cyclase [Clostridium cibarium]
MQEDTLNYEELKLEFENYQTSTELQLQKLSKRNIKLEEDINVLANIVEISKYINSFLSNENLIAMINDMVLGLLGVAYSTIFIEENNMLEIKVTNIKGKKLKLTREEKAYINSGQNYLLNYKDGIRKYDGSEFTICSVMGMPIKLREKFFGFILVEHHRYNFFTKEHAKFLKAISNQIAIALENSMLYRELQETVKRDPLLGIYNRRHFFELVEKKVDENKEMPFATIMMDLDDFKKINDECGHQFGDKVLIETTEIIKVHLEPKDILARYGGEELILFIEGFNDIKDVYNKVESIRSSVENNIIRGDFISKTITVSFGIGYCPRDGRNVNQVIKKADTLLYKGKKLGKNKVLYKDM